MTNAIGFFFCTHDRAADAYSPPFVAPHNGVAIRGFTDAINDSRKESDISRHPDDFDLYLVGEFNSHTGEILPIDKVLLLQGKQAALGANPNLDLFRRGNSPSMRDHEPNDSRILDGISN